jgi:hypothetical protein
MHWCRGWVRTDVLHYYQAGTITARLPRCG